MRISLGGFAETRDGGETWQTVREGLEENAYLWGLAADPADSDTLVASAAVGKIAAAAVRAKSGKRPVTISVGSAKLPEL
jgi:hypothetical protein